jgi:hypothetical protein
MPPRRRASAAAATSQDDARHNTPTPTPTLSPLLELRPRLLERSFWLRWRRTLMSSDLIFMCAQLALMRTAPAAYARQGCPSLLLTSVLMPASVLAAQAWLGPARYWRFRPWILLATAPVIARGNSCYARAYVAANAQAIAASAPSVLGRSSCALAWLHTTLSALQATAPACGNFMYAMLLPVSFRLRLVLQTAEALAQVAGLTPLVAPVLAPFFDEDGAARRGPPGPWTAPSAVALARRLLGGGACPSFVLVVLFTVWVGFLLPMGLVYLVEAAAKEAHLRELALGVPQAEAAMRAAEEEEEQGGAAVAEQAGDDEDGDASDHDDTSGGSDQAAARLLRLLSREGAPGGPALRLLRAGYVLAVVAALALLSWRVVDAATYAVLPRLAPGALERACPAFAAAAGGRGAPSSPVNRHHSEL